MCIQLTEETAPPAPAQPSLPTLPGFLKPSPRFELERQRLLDAEACLRAATRHVELARAADVDAALQVVEAQVARPFQKLLWANMRHMDAGNPSLLGDDEDTMTMFVQEIQRMRRERRFPVFAAQDAVCIRHLLADYPQAIATPGGWGDSEDVDARAVREALARDVAGEPVRGGE